MVFNDIDKIFLMRPLKILEDREFYISQLYLGSRVLTYQEKQILRDLNEQEGIVLFDVEIDSLIKTIEKFKSYQVQIGMISKVQVANILYAKKNNLILVTNNPLVSEYCRKERVNYMSIDESLKLLHKGEDKIRFIKDILNIEKIES